MIRAKRMLLCNRLEKIMEGRVDRIKAHTFHESVISELKDIISEVESCLHMFDVESTIEKAQRQEPVDPIPVNLPHQETPQLRTKALELAMTARGKPFYNDYYEECDILSKAADRFYTYITKGK